MIKCEILWALGGGGDHPRFALQRGRKVISQLQAFFLPARNKSTQVPVGERTPLVNSPISVAFFQQCLQDFWATALHFAAGKRRTKRPEGCRDSGGRNSGHITFVLG